VKFIQEIVKVPPMKSLESSNKVAKISVKPLISRITDPDQPPESALVSTKLVVRKSCEAK
jgi:DNA-binding LacI/PurR family transcriptional regulator